MFSGRGSVREVHDRRRVARLKQPSQRLQLCRRGYECTHNQLKAGCRTREVIRVKESTQAQLRQDKDAMSLPWQRAECGRIAYITENQPLGGITAGRVGTPPCRTPCGPPFTFGLEVDADALWPLREGGGRRGGGVLAAGVDAHGAAVHAGVGGAGGEEPQGVAALRHQLQSPPGAPAQVVAPADHPVRAHARHLHLRERRHVRSAGLCVSNIHVHKWTRPLQRVLSTSKTITITRSQPIENGGLNRILSKPCTRTQVSDWHTTKQNLPPLLLLQQQQHRQGESPSSATGPAGRRSLRRAARTPGRWGWAEIQPAGWPGRWEWTSQSWTRLEERQTTAEHRVSEESKDTEKSMMSSRSGIGIVWPIGGWGQPPHGRPIVNYTLHYDE
jgi:hypothetical protein